MLQPFILISENDFLVQLLSLAAKLNFVNFGVKNRHHFVGRVNKTFNFLLKTYQHVPKNIQLKVQRELLHFRARRDQRAQCMPASLDSF